MQRWIRTLSMSRLVIDLPPEFLQRRVEIRGLALDAADEFVQAAGRCESTTPATAAVQGHGAGAWRCDEYSVGRGMGRQGMIVLDTHILHWWVNQIPGRLSAETVTLIEEADDVGVSTISCFEMAWLVRHGRISLGMSVSDWLHEIDQAQLLHFLPVTRSIAVRAAGLPEIHKDPQDLIIIATALECDARLISFDTAFPAYEELKGMLISTNR